MRRNSSDVTELFEEEEARRERAAAFPGTVPPEYSTDFILDVLSPYATGERIDRMSAILSQRTRQVIPVLDGLSDPHNGAAILRTADAFGCQEVHAIRGRFPFAISRRVSRGTHRWLDLKLFPNHQPCVANLRSRNFKIFVASMNGEHSPESLADFPHVALVFGNEHKGPTQEMCDAADGTFQVPMTGFVESLNVSVASAIAVYSINKLHLERGTREPLSEDDKRQVLARYLRERVNNSEALLFSAAKSQG